MSWIVRLAEPDVVPDRSSLKVIVTVEATLACAAMSAPTARETVSNGIERMFILPVS
jgi:hypothetical protein